MRLEEHFESSSTLQRNERVKLAASFWNNVGAGMAIGGMAAAFFLDKPPGAWTRKMLYHPDYVREKIRASQLINRLHKCAFGEISLTMTQLRAIEILLRKCIPDLAAAEIKSEQTRRYVVEVPPVLNRDEWQRKYGQNPSLPPPSLQ
jgi:hypothetical protein